VRHINSFTRSPLPHGALSVIETHRVEAGYLRHRSWATQPSLLICAVGSHPQNGDISRAFSQCGLPFANRLLKKIFTVLHSMAPFQFLPLESQPRLKVRQSAASPDEITLTITRATTTITTTMELGGATASPTSEAAVTSTAPAPAATTTLPAAKPTDSNGVVAGAVLGSILGFLVLVVLIYKCCFNPNSALYIGYNYYSDYDDRSESTSRSDDIRRRGGWGSIGKNRRGDTIRRPERVRTRRHRRDRSRSTSPTRSETTRRSYYYRDRRPSSGMVKKDGMLGWALAPGYGRRYSGRRDIWAGERTTTADIQFLVDD
jgi:hypothetical protein